jgi:hypothetical protein
MALKVTVSMIIYFNKCTDSGSVSVNCVTNVTDLRRIQKSRNAIRVYAPFAKQQQQDLRVGRFTTVASVYRPTSVYRT